MTNNSNWLRYITCRAGRSCAWFIIFLRAVERALCDALLFLSFAAGSKVLLLLNAVETINDARSVSALDNLRFALPWPNSVGVAAARETQLCGVVKHKFCHIYFIPLSQHGVGLG